jgi:hypothetical protein
MRILVGRHGHPPLAKATIYPVRPRNGRKRPGSGHGNRHRWRSSVREGGSGRKIGRSGVVGMDLPSHSSWRPGR